MRVSFLIAAFNEERHLRECIKSCLSQTYGDVEVCVVDDGSTDGTAKLLVELGSDCRIVSHCFSQNQGKVAAFNKAALMATGEYFCLMGGDDTCPENRVEVSLNALKANNANLVYGGYTLCDESMNALGIKRAPKLISKSRILFNNAIPGGTMFFDRAVARMVFPIPSSLAFEDWWIAFISVHYFAVVCCDEALLNYRIHGSNDSISRVGRPLKEKDYARHASYYKEFLKFFSEHPTEHADKYRSVIAESAYFKDLYLVTSLRERLRRSRAQLCEWGLPRTLVGWFGLLFLLPLGSIAMDTVYQLIQAGRIKKG